ncbi:MAG: D-erythrulose kinase [Rhizobium sp.]|nr:D-erythrulose kinase [Rhizobium sp.]
MTRIHDAPENFATAALAGFSQLHSDRVRLIRNGVLRASASPRGKVAVVVGGGSGHYPAFAGYVGPGLADAAVAGDVFASPSTAAVARVGRLADHGGGVILGFGNYAGDVLNFGLAAERLSASGIDTRILAVTDDVASAPADQHLKRRGIAGDLMVFKIAGAAAEAGLPIDEVMRVGEHANQRTFSIGVAFAGCTLPGSKEPLFTVPKGHMAIGLGIHGEPGIHESTMIPAADLATQLVQTLLKERPEGAGRRVAVLLNGLGATKYEELFVLWTSISVLLKDAGLEIVAPEAGELVTSLDMAGCSLTFTWLDEELEKYWIAPCDAPAFRRGYIIPVTPAEALEAEDDPAPVFGTATPQSQASGKCIAELLSLLVSSLKEVEDELGRIDAQAGDGDHGQGMVRGCSAASEAAAHAVWAKAGAASVLAAAGDAWADRAGGTSGAIWGLALRAWSTAFSDQKAVNGHSVIDGARAALDAVMRLGGAKVGDKTLVDAFVPFVDTLEASRADGLSLTESWLEAAAAAANAADETKKLTPKLGRARPLAERSIGHADAGAVSFSLMARVTSDYIREQSDLA